MCVCLCRFVSLFINVSFSVCLHVRFFLRVHVRVCAYRHTRSDIEPEIELCGRCNRDDGSQRHAYADVFFFSLSLSLFLILSFSKDLNSEWS